GVRRRESVDLQRGAWALLRTTDEPLLAGAVAVEAIGGGTAGSRRRPPAARARPRPPGFWIRLHRRSQAADGAGDRSFDGGLGGGRRRPPGNAAPDAAARGLLPDAGSLQRAAVRPARREAHDRAWHSARAGRRDPHLPRAESERGERAHQ